MIRPPRPLVLCCRALLAEPTPELVTDAQRFAVRMLDNAAGYAAMALSPVAPIKERCEDVHHGHRALGDAIRALDTCSRLPARFLLAPGPWDGMSVREILAGAVRYAVKLAASLERAARELGLEPLSPFAGCLLMGGAQ